MRSINILVLCASLIAGAANSQALGWQSDAIAAAVAFHAANLPDECEALPPDAAAPAGHELQVGEETAARQALIVEFPCRTGAYNVTSVFLLSDQRGTVTEMLFPSPTIDVTYADEDAKTEVEAIVLTGERPMREVVNARYDRSSRTMTERDKWRGAGGAYSTTRWGYKDGRFQIMFYAVDPSFDGKDNPRTLIDKDIW